MHAKLKKSNFKNLDTGNQFGKHKYNTIKRSAALAMKPRSTVFGSFSKIID